MQRSKHPGGRPARTQRNLTNYSIWIEEKIAEGRPQTWLAKMLRVAPNSIAKYYRNVLAKEEVRYTSRRSMIAPEPPVANLDQPTYKFSLLVAKMQLQNPVKKQECTIGGVTFSAPASWDDMSYSQLSELWSVAQRAPSVRGFLFYAAEVLYKVTIRELPKSRYNESDYISGRYLIYPVEPVDGERGCHRVVEASLLDLTELLDSLKWLLSEDQTRVESRRTRVPMEMPPEADLYAPQTLLADLSLNEFLTAEDLRTSGAHVTKFLAVLYAPRTNCSTLRQSPDERDYAAIEARLRDVLSRNAGGLSSPAWWWWWEGNLRWISAQFPQLFTNAFNEPNRPALKTRPTDLLYMLSGGDFAAFEAIKRTNLYEGLRLIQERIQRIGEGR